MILVTLAATGFRRLAGRVGATSGGATYSIVEGTNEKSLHPLLMRQYQLVLNSNRGQGDPEYKNSAAFTVC